MVQEIKTSPFQALRTHLQTVPLYEVKGEITSVKGLLLEAKGISQMVAIGTGCSIISREKKEILGEVVGFRNDIILLMAFTDLEGVGLGCDVYVKQRSSAICPDNSWLGRVINGIGEPIDDKGPLIQGARSYPYRSPPPPAHRRLRVKGKMDLGVRALNSFIPCCYGQRLGVFAAAGVGKSMLLAMVTRFSDVGVRVIGLIGERGREVQEFLEDYLGPEGLAQTIVIVATSDESALMRRQAAYLTMAISEYFRDRGEEVLCLMDSVTRIAMAQREIGLAAGEPPTTKGYTPTVFAELPRLLERAGPGVGKGSITALFGVLVEGDDHNEPIADAVRGILDGHIILDRSIAERGRFPAINIVTSISRMAPGCNDARENQLVQKARHLLSTYDNMIDMIRLGAYKKGTDPLTDEAMFYFPLLEKYLNQSSHDKTTIDEGFIQLETILNQKMSG